MGASSKAAVIIGVFVASVASSCSTCSSGGDQGGGRQEKASGTSGTTTHQPPQAPEVGNVDAPRITEREEDKNARITEGCLCKVDQDAKTVTVIPRAAARETGKELDYSTTKVITYDEHTNFTLKVTMGYIDNTGGNVRSIPVYDGEIKDLAHLAAHKVRVAHVDRGALSVATRVELIPGWGSRSSSVVAGAGRLGVNLIVSTTCRCDPNKPLPLCPPAGSGSTSPGFCIVVGDGNPDYGPAPLSVSFGGEAECSGGEPTYTWEFGDGSPTSKQTNPSHVYTKPGDYTASVTVACGNATASDSVDITVEESEPEGKVESR